MTREIMLGVRADAGLLQRLDNVTAVMALGKADCVRAFIEKLVEDNAVLTDYPGTTDRYAFIKSKLAELPQDLVIVKNGYWIDVSDFIMSRLCSEFWRTSVTVFGFWKQLVKKYEALSHAFKEYLDDDENSRKWGMHVHFRLGADPIRDPRDLFEDKYWLDLSAALKVTFAYATEQGIRESSAENIVKELLKNDEYVEKKKLLRLVVNARRGPRLQTPVKGKDDLSAVYTEGVES